MSLVPGLGLGLLQFRLQWLNLLSLPGNRLMLAALSLAARLGPRARPALS